MSQKKMMILGASILQLPAISKAREMGLQVIAVDIDKHAIGFQYADICLEISTIDTPAIVKAAKYHEIDGIMTLASDMPIRSVATVAGELNIVGISGDTALKATNKVLMRECLKNNNVPVPAFFRVENYHEYRQIIEQNKRQYIVKPADNSGSRGVFLVSDVYDKKAVDFAFQYSKQNSRCGEIIVEDFMEGPEVSVETLSISGAVHIIAITDKFTSGPPRFVEMGHSQPSQLSVQVQKQIEEVAVNAIHALGIDQGPSHTEIIITREGPKIVEIGARLGGDNITTHLVPLSTGIDMVKCSIQIALGETPDFDRKINAGSAIKYFNIPAGKIIKINNIDEVKKLSQIRQVSFVKNIGETVGNINNSTDRIGFVIAQSLNAPSAVKACEEASSYISIEIA